ncbi:MAG: MFS transporter [Clostridia bacterium]|nr:MFS transporter [Clostridia bacterium]
MLFGENGRWKRRKRCVQMGEKQSLTGRYSAIQGLYWMNYVTVSAYVSVYLLDQGLSNTWIGILLAVAGIIAAVAQPLVAAYADRPDSLPLRKLIIAILGVFVAAAGVVTAFYRQNILVTCVAYGVCLTLLWVLTPLVNSLGVQSAARGYAVRFSTARGVGSLMYSIASLAMGQLLPVFGARLIPAAMLCIYLGLIGAVTTYPLPDGRAAESAPKRAERKGFLGRYPRYAWVLAGALGLYISHAILNAFTFQIVLSKGGAEREMGLCTALACVFEMPTMFLFDRLKKHFSASLMLRVSAVFFLLKALGSWLVTDMTGFYIVQFTQMFAWGLIAVCSVYFVEGEVGAEDAVQGQAWFTMMLTAGNIISSLVGGKMIDAIGVNSLLILGVATAGIGAAIYMAVLREGKAPVRR